MVKMLHSLLVLSFLFALQGCREQAEHSQYDLLAGQDEIIAKQLQGPWSLAMRYLPENNFEPVAYQRGRPAEASPTTTATFKLRVKSRNGRTPVPELLQIQAPQLSAEQQQTILFYHMAEAGQLLMGEQSIRPVTAYVEMSPQQTQYLDVVFVFVLPKRQLFQALSISFVLDKAFFLDQPVQFAFPKAKLLSAIQ